MTVPKLVAAGLKRELAMTPMAPTVTPNVQAQTVNRAMSKPAPLVRIASIQSIRFEHCMAR